MKLEKSFGYNKHNFEVYSHAGIFFLEKDKIRIAKFSNMHDVTMWFNGFVYGMEKGYSDGWESLEKACERTRIKIQNNQELTITEKQRFGLV